MSLFMACGEIASSEAPYLSNAGLGGLKRLQLHVTIGAPDAAIEADDERAFLQKLIRADDVAFGILQREGRRHVAGFLGALGSTGGDQLGGDAMHRFDHASSLACSDFVRFRVGLWIEVTRRT